MTKLAIVGYPTLADSDHEWIESVRARHDPQASRISAHFTLVFPVELVMESVADHASAILAGQRSIPFVLRHAEVFPDRIIGGGHVLLVPEEGRDEITALHDRLYEGLLRPHLRGDIPFLPHITVGGHRDLGECARVAEALNRAPLAVQGDVQTIDLIDVGSDAIKSLMKCSLESHAPLNERMQS